MDLEGLSLAIAQVAAKGTQRFARTDDSRAVALALHAPRRLARQLAAHVQANTYRFEPLRKSVVAAQGKRREIYQSTFTDAIIYRWLANRLNAALGPTLPPYIYGFRKGVSSLHAVRALAKTLRNAKLGPPPGCPGLFVLRRDITQYTDHMRTEDGAPLWQALARAGLWRDDVAPRALLREALQAKVWTPAAPGAQGKPVAHGAAGEAGLLGFVAAGTAIANIMANVYLLEVDEAIAKQARFYGRFGDDIVAVFDDIRVATQTSKLLDQRIDQLGMRFGASKRQDVYVSGSGFCPKGYAGFVGAAAVDWLGMRVTAKGALALTPPKARGLLGDLERRMRLGARMASGEPPVVAEAIANALRGALNPTSPLVAAKLADYLARIDCRGQLAELDHRLLLRASEVAAGRQGPRAFRAVSMRQWHETWGVPSLVTMRNRGRRGRRAP